MKVNGDFLNPYRRTGLKQVGEVVKDIFEDIQQKSNLNCNNPSKINFPNITDTFHRNAENMTEEEYIVGKNFLDSFEMRTRGFDLSDIEE